MKSKRLKREATKGVMDYLQSALSRSSLLQLYTDEDRGRFVCKAVLQSLTPEAQQVVVRLSCSGGAFPCSGVKVWTNQYELIIAEIQQWAIIQQPEDEEDGKEGAKQVTMTQEFLKGLQEALLNPDASPWKSLSPSKIRALEKEAGEKPRDIAFEDLERYTQVQWDAVLHFLVGTPNMKVQPSPAAIHFLLQTGLMQPDPEYKGSQDDAPLVITEKGYDFMLQDNSQQVWHFVVQYLKSVEAHKKHKQLAREALLLLVCLGFAQLGEAYTASGLSKDTRVMIKDLALFGLLYVRKIGKQSIFFPTRVAMQLVSFHEGNMNGGAGDSTGSSSSFYALTSKALAAAVATPSPQDSSHLAIIVQTNFQLCAYTTSELHVSMLGLFCDVHTIRRLPNVVFMTITRDSVKSAFCLGIQARQILRFLEKHAHPKVRVPGQSPVPCNVIDQVWLWDRERHRVRWTEVFSHQCLMNGEFQAVHQYAVENRAHAWSSEPRKQLLISYSHAERFQNFVRQWRAKAAVRQAEAEGL